MRQTCFRATGGSTSCTEERQNVTLGKTRCVGLAKITTLSQKDVRLGLEEFGR